MGASNAIRVYTAWGSTLGDHAMRALVYMALIAVDGDAEPWFGLGQEAVAERAFGRAVPDRDKDPAGHHAAIRSVGRAITELRAAGAIQTSERARFGTQRAQNARYRLYLDGPSPVGEKAQPRKWKRELPPPDANRRVDNQAPPDAKRPVDGSPPDAWRPMPPDAKRPAGAETTGRFAVDHRTENVHPQDEKRPTNKEEEEEERRKDSGSVVDATVEGTQPGWQPDKESVIDGGGQKTRSPDAGMRPMIPYGLPGSAATQRDTRPGWCRKCHEQTRMREADDNGTPVRCPDCHPLTQEQAS